MALVLKDRVKETTTTTGTGTVTLAGASTGYQSFSVIGNANTTYYCIAGQGTAEWEVGIGTYTASGTTLSRDTILASSNSGSVVTFSAGTKDVFVVYPAGKSVNLDASGNATALGTPASCTVTNFTGTASININGTVGATTPNTGAFTTLSSTGNTTLGDASTDTVTVNGYMGVGGGGVVGNGLQVVSSALSGVNQTGVYSALVGTSGGTNRVRAFLSFPASAAASYTVNDMSGFWAADVSKGAGSTITNLHGLYIADQTQGTNNYGITSLVSSGANKWNIYASGTAQNYFAGNVGIGTSSPNALLELAANNTGITTGAALNTLRFYDTDTSSAADQPFGAIEWYGADTSNTSIRAFMRVSAESATVPSYMSFGTATAAGSATERLRIDSSGNVGIGVTPSATTGSGVKGFEIGGIGNGLLGNSANVWATQNVYFNAGFKKAGAGYATMYNQSGGTHNWNVSTTSGGAAGDAITFTQAMTLDASGNLGIGTSSPNDKLTVASDNYLSFQTSSTTFNSGRVARIGGVSVGSGNGYLSFETYEGGSGGGERARITSSGNVGIGTTSPGSKLDVKGTLRLSGSTSGYVGLAPAAAAGSTTYTLPSADGSSGQVLSTNGTGTLSWATAGGGGFAAGTAMLFVQTAAPTGWTKSTTHNDKALRVVSGSASSGGSVAFTTAFASQGVSGTVGNTTLTTSQIPSHSHTFYTSNTGGGSNRPRGDADGSTNENLVTTSTTGTGGSHNHSFSGTAINLAVQYVDVIIATKD